MSETGTPVWLVTVLADTAGDRAIMWPRYIHRFQMEGVLSQTRAQETPRAVAALTQDRTMGQPNDDGGAREECSMSQAQESLHGSGPARSHRQQ
jgi:hypothetical protein